jgi:hypothetical protein
MIEARYMNDEKYPIEENKNGKKQLERRIKEKKCTEPQTEEMKRIQKDEILDEEEDEEKEEEDEYAKYSKKKS